MRILVAVLLCLSSAGAAWAEGPSSPRDAELSLFVFRDGRPVGDVALEIGEVRARTDAAGGLLVRVPAGRERLRLLADGAEVLGLDLLTADGEVLELIVTLREGLSPQVLIESSGAGGVDAPPVADAPVAEDDPARRPGLLQGRVLSAESGRPVANARIFVSGTSASTQTFPDGRYALELPPGNYTLSVVHADYATQTLDNLRVIPGQAVTADLELAPSGIELAEYVVTAPYIEGSVAAIVELQRSKFAIAEVLGAEQMARSADSDAADALTRVTGLTVQDGKYVQIRGLDPRFSTTLLNGSALPSPDPNRRVVPLDLFPIGVLENIEVAKTYSPDLPGSFAGGLIALNTRGVPDEGFAKAKLSLEYDSETTLKDGLTYEGGGLDFLGFDDGTRELPAPVDRATQGGSRDIRQQSPSNPDGLTPEEIERLGESFPVVYDVDRQTNPPGGGLSLGFGDRYATGFGDFGFLAAGVFSNDWTNRTGPENTVAITGNGGDLVLQDQFQETQTSNDVTLGGILTVGAEWGDDHRITSNTFPLRKTSNVARVRDGLRAENDQNVREYLLDFVARELILEQLQEEHHLPALADLEVDWRATYANSSRNQPDRRQYRYVQTNAGFEIEQSSLARRYSAQDEDILGFGLDLTLPLGADGPIDSKLKAGVQYDDRSRTSQVQTFQYGYAGGSIPRDIRAQPSAEDIYNAQNIGPDGFILDDLTGANDDYEGDQTVQAGYGMVDVTLWDAVRVTGGARLEDAELDVRTFQSAGTTEREVRSGFGETDLLPAATVTWYLPNDMQLRGAFGQTLSRPELNELSPSTFVDPETLDDFIGNPDLEQTKITNYDLRWEWYLSSTESVTVAAFYKDFDKPIEVVRVPGFNAPRSFQNAKTATNYGFELGFRKELGFVGGWLDAGRSVWSQLYVEGNFTWIESEVKLDPDSAFTNTNDARPLQGQAPYVLNLKLGWIAEALGADVTMLFNVLGERIDEVGVQGQPDIKEQPSPRLDFAWDQKLGDSWSAKLTLENLLFSKVEYKQGGLTQRGYDEGLRVGISAKYAFD